MPTAFPSCRQYRLLISGSRQANPAMLDYANRAVAAAKARGWMILVGDNPQGVDAAVIDACDRLGVNVLVCGTDREPRKGSVRPDSYWKVFVEVALDEEYPQYWLFTARDRWMVSMCDRMLAIWNGSSRGTKAAYDHAVGLGKLADLRTFKPAKR